MVTAELLADNVKLKNDVMWQQDYSQLTRRSSLQILPCTVSQLLSASQVGSDEFTICDCALYQVSIVGVVRGLSPLVTFIHLSVDDMTGPPISVKQWVNSEDCAVMSGALPGTYVKVTGSLRNFSGQRSLLAMDIRCIKDLNEMTSHMLEVVQAHMKLSVKEFDVNMNTTVASRSGHSTGKGLSTTQDQVFHVIRTFSDQTTGISFDDLKADLQYVSEGDVRSALAFLLNEGHVFTTIDEHHYRTTV